MAIDGVAPRAKMNQQRARRFRAAKDAADMASLLEKQGSDHEEKDKPAESGVLDSNLITPGTGFMESLSSALQYYVHLRINNDPGWKGVKVILSDATVPGEGEHKVMSYIRLQRNLPGFDPNTRHCLYGLDADLIMLALATHEVHFSVLREDVRRPPPDSKDHKAHNMKKAAGKTYLEPKEVPSQYLEDIISKQKFQFLNVWVLRDYLAESLRVPDPTVKFDLERLIDDFVFMCLFVGNDFLPHVPSLEISEGAIDLLMSVYKKEFVRMGGYLTNATEVNLKGVEHFVQTLGSHENAIFKKRQQEQLNWEHRARRFPAKSNLQSDATFVADKVNLGEDGWKERYYTEKFEAQSDDDRETVKKDAVLKYVEGICWVMHYYYQGVCSWQWFYPYHYAPFGSDFRDLDQLDIHFELGKPFKPFDQLMGVLPAASAGALPLCYRKLMTDQASPILDLYPTEFDLDLNGRKQAWKAICKLPFIDEARLLSEIAKVENTLTDVERRRNTLGVDQLFINISHPLAAKILTFWERNKDHPKLQRAKVRTLINPRFSDGMNGYVYISDKPICPPEIPSPLHDMKTITPNKVLLVFYKLPDLHPHIPRPPEGVRMPKKVIGKHDLLPPPTLWHQSAVSQSRFSTRPVPPKSIAGSSLAEICHSLVAKTYSSEDRGNAMKRSHDAAMNHSGKKRKRRGGKSKKRNA
ncbi:5'-3' exoribonuclease 3-like isoform X2 [Salvia hispanica]|nr:5'-3' exoribonuclease 3-like isoform X2 [Salvia hispanica]